ncbi:hypothetical protein ACXZ9C_11460 [Streptococcus agalactiae]
MALRRVASSRGVVASRRVASRGVRGVVGVASSRSVAWRGVSVRVA